LAVQNHKLSKRENEVVQLLLQGKSNKQIAAMLGISTSTVEFHLKNVYAKLEVRSRTEVILNLGKSTGVIDKEPQESIVAARRMKDNNRENFSFKELEMRKRIFYYFLAGLIFGIGYWEYLNGIAGFFNAVGSGVEPNVVGGLAIWMFLSVVFLTIFGVWLIPTIFPAVYEFRHSEKVGQAVVAVIVVWVSAVLGYYLTYFVLLAFFGLPNMEYLLIFGKHSATFWQDWAAIFNKLILFSFLKWAVVGILAGGVAGFATSSIYSFWVKKTRVFPA
jgi:DNA-binding CsgD family transcriptional regulator